MGDQSSIEWTDATWNPTTGCDKVSPGCKNCYAERLSERLQKMGNQKYKNGFKFTLHPEALELPIKWKTPKRIFVNSMSDLFHPEMPNEYLHECFRVMFKAEWHTYQILTKRPSRMAEYINDVFPNYFDRDRVLPRNIWLGTSVEMEIYKSRIDALRRVHGTIKFLSCEPLLESPGKLNLADIDWVIAGGESGPGHRPLQADWIREIRDQCKAQNVAFFFKQWGGDRPGGEALLDGKEYREFPERGIIA